MLKTFMQWLAIPLLFSGATAKSETAGQASQVQIRTLAVLPTTDTSGYNLGSQIQYSLSSLFQQTQYYQVSMGNQAVTGYTEPEVARAFQGAQTQIIAFSYLEKERISLFLMDSVRPKEFIVVAEGLVDPSLGNQVTPQVIDYKLKLAFNTLIADYYQSKFQPLPGAAPSTSQVVATYDPNDPKRRAEEARKLYRELAAIQETNTYIGATIGMARYSGTAGSSSTVSFGGFFGMKAGEKLRAEFGLDIFRYLTGSGSLRYRIPFAEKYIALHAGLTAGAILAELTPPRDSITPGLQGGSINFGPSISFDIPLLGAYIRGEMKFLLGGGSVLFASYGISYSI